MTARLTKIRPSRRAMDVEYAIRDVVLPARALEKKGIKVLKLNVGDPGAYDFPVPKHIVDALAEAARMGHNYYAPSEGDPELRLAITEREKRRNGLEVSPDDVVVTTGVTESLQLLFASILEPQDEVLIPGPSYPPYTSMARFFDANPVAYRCIEENGWQPDVDEMRTLITEDTRAIVLINPNNPTGAVYPAKTVKAVLDLAGEHGLPVIADEIYDDLTFDEPHVATASLAKDVPVVEFNGFSKVYLVPGWRLGYTVFHGSPLADLKEAFLKIARLRLSANTVCQRAMISALRGPQDHVKATVDKIRRRRDFAVKRLNAIPGISTQRPGGAFYVFPRIDAVASGKKTRWADDKAWVLDLLQKEHVLTVHGSGFDPVHGKGHFRAVILPDEKLLGAAFDGIERFTKGA